MTFEDIKALLGNKNVEEISRSVLLTAQRSGQADDPDAHARALQELLTALLAVLLHRNIVDEHTSRAHTMLAATKSQELGQRLGDLLESMGRLDGPQVVNSKHKH